jgi:hypothetical protein
MGANGKQDQFRIGFLTASEVPDKGFVGGLLVTTHNGRPLEFQCTVPVRPNSTQEILYGPTLEPFILGELIGGALIEKAGVKPHLILTDRNQILELRNHVAAPVALVPGPDEESESPAERLAVRDVPRLVQQPQSAGVDSAPAADDSTVPHSETSERTEPEPAPGSTLPTAETVSAALSPAMASSEAATRPVLSAIAIALHSGEEMRLGRQKIRFHASHGEDAEVVAAESKQVPADADLREPFERVREALLETLRSGALR